MSLTTDNPAEEMPESPKGLRDLWASKEVRAVRRVFKAVCYRIFRLAGELTAVVLGLAIALSWTALSVLDRQSTNLTILRPNIKLWFAETFNGQEANFDSLKVTWLPATNQYVVAIENMEIRGDDGKILEHFSLLRSTLVFDDKNRLQPKLINAEVSGGALSFVEDESGNITAGLGLPETVGQVGPVYRNDESGTGEIDLISSLQHIDFIQINDADIYIRNGVSGIDLKSKVNSARASFSKDGSVTVAADGAVEQETGEMPFSVSSVLSDELSNLKMRLNIEGARPDEIAPIKGRFRDLRGLAAPVNMMVAVDFSRAGGLKSAKLDLGIGKGQFSLFRKNRLESYELDSLVARSSLALGEERMDVEQLDLKSPNLSFDASGFLTELGKWSDGNVNSSPTFDLAFANIRANRTPSLPIETRIKKLDVVGRADFDSRQLKIDEGTFAFFDSLHAFNGQLILSEGNEPKTLLLNSSMSGALRPDEFLSLWPVDAFGGARRWIERSVKSGEITQLDTALSLDESFFAAPALSEDRFKLYFGGKNFDVQYMESMPEAAGVSGSGEIIGNRLFAEFDGGAVAGAIIDNGTATIPVLLPKGGDIQIKANGRGSASDLLRIADHPPFEIARRYDLDPQKLKGQGSVSIEVTRPLLEFFPREDIIYRVNGQFSEVSAPFQIGQHEITNGEVRMDADRERVIMSGPVDIGGWRADVKWQETFGGDQSLSQYELAGDITAADLDRFGFGSRSWFDGSAAIDVKAQGRGRDISTASVDVDLTNSELSIERVWMKLPSEAARLSGQFKRTAEDGYVFDKVAIEGEGVNISGSVELDSEYKTRLIDIENIEIPSLIEGAVVVRPDRNVGQLGAEINARFLDVSPWTEDVFATRQSNIDVPFLLRGKIDRLILDSEYEVTDAVVDFKHSGDVIETARLEARSGDAPLLVELTTQDSLDRLLSMRVPDASKAVSAFLGLDNTKGGTLEVDIKLPAAGEEGAYIGEADMRDFTLREAPAMAQLLSIASLTGLADTLTSGSMKFDRFTVPFTMIGDDIAVREARLYGPALGMTGNGDIDLDLRALDFDGTLVPAYTANSILGDIPVLGDIFVQEKDGGLFALTYTVSGPFEKIQIAVNPLSALTPGFLRGIFKRDRSEIDDAMREAIEEVAPKPSEDP